MRDVEREEIVVVGWARGKEDYEGAVAYRRREEPRKHEETPLSKHDEPAYPDGARREGERL
jgi:hypothetical protein